MNRIAWGVGIAIAIAGCGKSDPSSKKYWDKMLGGKKSTEGFGRIGDELKTPEQKKWGAELCLQHYERNPGLAAKALGQLGESNPAIIDKLITSLQSNDVTLMRNAANALGRLPGGQKATPELIRILDSWRPKNPKDLTGVRQAATKALGAFGAREAVPALTKLVSDRSHGLIVNLKAIEALANIGDPRSVPALILGLYLACPEDKCSAEARRGLNRIGKAAIPALLRVVRRQDPEIEKLAREKKMSEGSVTAVPFVVIGDLGDASTARQLAEFLRAPSFTRLGAISAIGFTGTRDMAMDLIKLYDKATLEERTNILHALHRLGDKRAIPFLTKVLKKREDPNFTWTAGMAISLIGGSAELPVIEAALDHDKRALPSMRGDDASVTKQGIVYFTDFVKRLAAAKGCENDGCWAERLRSPEKQVRIKASRMLAFAADKAAAERALVGALADPDAEVREEIVFALSRVSAGGPETLKALADRIQQDQDKAGMKGPLLLYALLVARLRARTSA